MSVFKAYEGFLVENASQITAVESSLRTLTYFLPGRFKDAELAGEAIYTSLNLLGLYHDSLLSSLLSSPSTSSLSSSQTPSLSLISSPSPSSPLQHTPSPHARYTTQLSKASLSYRLLARALVVLSHTELLSEMVARRRLGRKGAWDVVLSIECVKAILRLSLLRLTNYRPTIQPPLPEREVDPAVLEEERTKAIARLESNSSLLQRSNSTQKSRSTSSSGMRIENVDENGNHSGLAEKKLLLEQENLRNSTYWRGSRTGFTRPTLASLRANSFPPPPNPNPNESQQPRLGSNHPLATNSITTRSRSDSSSSSSSDETLVDPSSTLLSPPTSSNTQQQPPWTQREVDEFLLSRTLKPTDVRPPEELVRQLRGNLGKFSEILWILRPLIYVLTLRRFTVRSYKPWLISFLMEWFSRYLFKKSVTLQNGAGNLGSGSMISALVLAMVGNNRILNFFARRVLGIGSESGKVLLKPISEVDENEFSKRDRAFWWYLIRGPAWYGYTRPKLEGIVNATESRPVLGLVGSIVKDYLPLIDEYYYYTAT